MYRIRIVSVQRNKDTEGICRHERNGEKDGRDWRRWEENIKWLHEVDVQRKVNACPAQLQNVACSSYGCFSAAIQDQRHEEEIRKMKGRIGRVDRNKRSDRNVRWSARRSCAREVAL